jgi:hypothetical protein
MNMRCFRIVCIDMCSLFIKSDTVVRMMKVSSCALINIHARPHHMTFDDIVLQNMFSISIFQWDPEIDDWSDKTKLRKEELKPNIEPSEPILFSFQVLSWILSFFSRRKILLRIRSTFLCCSPYVFVMQYKRHVSVQTLIQSSFLPERCFLLSVSSLLIQCRLNVVLLLSDIRDPFVSGFSLCCLIVRLLITTWMKRVSACIPYSSKMDIEWTQDCILLFSISNTACVLLSVADKTAQSSCLWTIQSHVILFSFFFFSIRTEHTYSIPLCELFSLTDGQIIKYRFGSYSFAKMRVKEESASHREWDRNAM